MNATLSGCAVPKVAVAVDVTFSEGTPRTFMNHVPTFAVCVTLMAFGIELPEAFPFVLVHPDPLGDSALRQGVVIVVLTVPCPALPFTPPREPDEEY
jgi:hypothetical protein